MRTALLALLLLRANRVVPADWLIDTLWESAPPRTASTSLQVMVHHLRRALDAEQDRLRTEPRGYLLKVADHELDLHVFATLTVRARAALGERAYHAAAADLRLALDLWHGPALGGATAVRLLRDEAQRLDGLRLAALEDRIGADLAVGRTGELVDELAEAVTAHPTRERLRGQLMLALHRSGRTADALAAYRAGRHILVRDLGLEPGASLQAMHAAMLRGDPQLLQGPDQTPAAGLKSSGTRPATPVPAQLPHDVPHFTGRDRELGVLAGLGEPAGSGPAAHGVPVVAIDGMPGVGKTALALHFAHRIADRWPDGQLYLDLHGFDAVRPPTAVGDALHQLLSALGVAPDAVPDGTDERAAMYRSVLAGKRVLLMLDNAASAQQVRPLLPGTGRCPVIVTSRNRLAGLVVHDGAAVLTVAPLSMEDSLALLATILGESRMAAEPQAARELAERSGCLPLALRISAANLLTQPERSIGDFVAELAARPLDALSVDGDDDSAARLAFDVSYRCLPVRARRLFCLLGVVPGAELATTAAVALTGDPAGQVRADLDRLAAAHLVEQYRPGRWRQHDLLRRYAAERGGHDESEEVRGSAVDGLMGHYLAHARTAVRLLYPQAPMVADEAADDAARPVAIDDPAAAVAWFDLERPNLVACALYAADHDVNPTAWQLVDAASRLFLLRHHPDDWMATSSAALDAAMRAGDVEGASHMHLSLGNAHYSAGDNAAAELHYTQVIGQSGRVGWPAGEAAARANLGVIHAGTGRPHEALRQYRYALDLHRRIDGRYGEAVALDNIGGICLILGQLSEAIARHREALTIHQETGFRAGAALALAHPGNALRELGDLEEALDTCTLASEIYREVGSRTGQAQALCCMADVHADAGRYGDALTAATAALAITEETGDRRSRSEALNILGTLEAVDGRLDAASELHGQALQLATATGYQVEIQEALVGLAEVHRRAGRYPDALAHVRRALKLARVSHHRIAEPAQLIALARIHLDLGAHRVAAERLHAAARISAATGQRLRHGHALALLAEAVPVPG